MSIKIEQLDSENLEKDATIWVAWRGNEKIGTITYREAENCLPFVYDLISDPRYPEVVAMLIKRVERELKAKGYERCIFTIKQDSPALIQLVLAGRYRIEEIIASKEL